MSELENLTYSRVWIDDILLQDKGISVLINSDEPSLPSVRNLSVTVPGRHGSYDFGAFFEPREFTLNCVYNRQNYNELKTSLQVLNRLLLDEFGRPKTVRLRFGDEADKYFNARLSNGVPVDRRSERGFISINLTAYDPYKYASANQYDPKEDYLYDRGYLYDTGLMYDNPESFKWEYERHYSGIYNYSSLNADLQLEIQGTVTNPSVTNLNDNTKLTLPSINNGRLIIDGKRFAVIRNGQDILEGSNYNFFNIQPGQVGFLFEGDNPNATVNYRWIHKFM